MAKIEKGDLLHGSGHALGRGRVSTQPIFSHLKGTDSTIDSLRAEGKCIHSLTIPVKGMVWLVIASILVLGEVLALSSDGAILWGLYYWG
jgi:hypothetical protein